MILAGLADGVFTGGGQSGAPVAHGNQAAFDVARHNEPVFDDKDAGRSGTRCFPLGLSDESPGWFIVCESRRTWILGGTGGDAWIHSSARRRISINDTRCSPNMLKYISTATSSVVPG